MIPEDKKWSDESISVSDCKMQNSEYIDLSQVWHDASEEPTYKHGILYQDKLGKVYFTTKSDAIALHGNWGTFVEVTLMIRWAYIDDLLPKKFGNSERLKGGEE